VAATATTWPHGLDPDLDEPDLAHLDGLTADELLAWAIGRFGDRFAVVTSFQAEGMVVLDLARRIDPGVRVLTLDTGRLPDPADVAAMVARHGPNLFHKDPALRRLCCHVRKVAPLDRALAGVEAWSTGLRRDGGPARGGIGKAERDDAHGGILKLNPLADWTREQVWAYVRSHRLPVSSLYAQGYTSIGCAPCTRPTRPGEDERAGRWWWEADQDRECGLHTRLTGAPASPDDRFSAALDRLRADTNARTWETSNGC
jgi:phosphoadenosine phosphosulfate reductase